MRYLWTLIALALSACASENPDFPRAYARPAIAAPRISRSYPEDKPRPETARQALEPATEPRQPAYAQPAETEYRPPAAPRAVYRPSQPPSPPLAGGPPRQLTDESSQTRSGYAPPPFRPDLVPQGYGPTPRAAPSPLSDESAGRAASSGRFADWTQEDYRYRIGAGDELALRFLLNPDLNGPVIVGPDGRGVFPLVSAVKVADLNVDQANAVLSEAYGQILRRPQVEVLITAYGSSQIYVGGEVRMPGVHQIKGQLTTAQAIMTAGGLAPTARAGKVAILRQRPNGQLLMRQVDLKAYLTKGAAEADFAILPGDLIFVPRSKIAEVDLFVEQYINGVLPFSRSIGYNLNNRGTTP